MSLLRRLAVHTLKAVIWLSSPSTRKWAEAMLAEVACIPSDWDAFVWAFGSLRVLFVEQSTGPASLAEIPNAARILVDSLNVRFWFRLLGLGSILPFFVRSSFHAANTMQQVGAALIAAATVYLLTQAVRARPQTLPPPADQAAMIALYRSELMRERDFHRGETLWLRLAVMMPGFVLLCLGAIRADPSTLRTQVGCLALYFFLNLLAIPNNWRFERRYARQLRDLDVLEAKNK